MFLLATIIASAIVTTDIGPEHYDIGGTAYFPCHLQQTVIVNYRGDFIIKILPGFGAVITRTRARHAPWKRGWRVTEFTKPCFAGPRVYK